ncbi:MAG TPA: hypothetical protein VF267_06010 [Gammaproteobacteria bacterium]
MKTYALLCAALLAFGLGGCEQPQQEEQPDEQTPPEEQTGAGTGSPQIQPVQEDPLTEPAPTETEETSEMAEEGDKSADEPPPDE